MTDSNPGLPTNVVHPSPCVNICFLMFSFLGKSNRTIEKTGTKHFLQEPTTIRAAKRSRPQIPMQVTMLQHLPLDFPPGPPAERFQYSGWALWIHKCTTVSNLPMGKSPLLMCLYMSTQGRGTDKKCLLGYWVQWGLLWGDTPQLRQYTRRGLPAGNIPNHEHPLTTPKKARLS